MARKSGCDRGMTSTPGFAAAPELITPRQWAKGSMCMEGGNASGQHKFRIPVSPSANIRTGTAYAETCHMSSRCSLTAPKPTSISLLLIFCPELWSTETDPDWQTASLGDFAPEQVAHDWSQPCKGQLWILWMPPFSLSLFTYYWNDRTWSEDLAGRVCFQSALGFFTWDVYQWRSCVSLDTV